jgi:hypothetical protein
MEQLLISPKRKNAIISKEASPQYGEKRNENKKKQNQNDQCHGKRQSWVMDSSW